MPHKGIEPWAETPLVFQKMNIRYLNLKLPLLMEPFDTNFARGKLQPSIGSCYWNR